MHKLRAYIETLRAYIDRLRAYIETLRAYMHRLRAYMETLRAYIDRLRAYIETLRAYSAGLQDALSVPFVPQPPRLEQVLERGQPVGAYGVGYLPFHGALQALAVVAVREAGGAQAQVLVAGVAGRAFGWTPEALRIYPLVALRNFVMALPLNLLVVSPLVRSIFAVAFRKK